MKLRSKGRTGAVSHKESNPPAPTSTQRSRKGKAFKSASVVRSSDDEATGEDEFRHRSSPESDQDEESEGARKRKRRRRTSDEKGQVTKKSRGDTAEKSILINDSSTDNASPSPVVNNQYIVTRSKGKEPQKRDSDNVVRRKGVRFMKTNAPTVNNTNTEVDRNNSVPGEHPHVADMRRLMYILYQLVRGLFPVAKTTRAATKTAPEAQRATANPQQEHSEPSDKDPESSSETLTQASNGDPANAGNTVTGMIQISKVQHQQMLILMYIFSSSNASPYRQNNSSCCGRDFCCEAS